MSISSIERVRERFRQLQNDPRFVAEGMKLAFADDVVRLLDARGLKRTELAEKLNTNRGYITRVLNTEYNLTVETIARIALALDARVSLRMYPREAGQPERNTRARHSAHVTRSLEFVVSDRPASRPNRRGQRKMPGAALRRSQGTADARR